MARLTGGRLQSRRCCQTSVHGCLIDMLYLHVADLHLNPLHATHVWTRQIQGPGILGRSIKIILNTSCLVPSKDVRETDPQRIP